ncbi:hypothetical protein L873DRAFT_527554 [Choiromyces venosus 120613-1]|uniref:Uncharacterized protein n=1 Tax=Choiromyces venosus 120613-1 TaxID=1336337 RepID=A0A3N4K878_9PEZI|nr:hypothetical protein L873DRAFT_527554 [Choiromyces venosus 120613-1]
MMGKVGWGIGYHSTAGHSKRSFSKGDKTQPKLGVFRAIKKKKKKKKKSFHLSGNMSRHFWKFFFCFNYYIQSGREIFVLYNSPEIPAKTGLFVCKRYIATDLANFNSNTHHPAWSQYKIFQKRYDIFQTGETFLKKFLQ